MLEIKLPREITKSPIATETAITGFLQAAGASTIYARNFEGKVPHYGSLEIASIEGVIHFYIRVQRRFRTLMETNFYAQYPTIEIIESEDYTKLIHFHHLSTDVQFWGMTYRTGMSWEPWDAKTGSSYPTTDDKGKPIKYKMKADFLPIKTYVDFGLDKDPKEEYKTDPLTQILEAMGSIGKGEHMWYQVLIQDESVYNGTTKLPKFYVNEITHEHMSLTQMADARKKQIRNAGHVKAGDVVYNAYGNKETKRVPGPEVDGKPTTLEVDVTYGFRDEEKGIRALTKDEIKLSQSDKDELEIINRKMGKPLAVTLVRLAYVAKKENFNGGQTATTLSFSKLFTGWNKLIPGNLTDPYDYPWEKMGIKRVYWRAEECFEAYVEREGFYPHVKERKALDKWEDLFFWPSSMKTRKLFRMVFEAMFYPFEHPNAEGTAMTLNLEEIATLWHLPGAVAATPTLPRIDSTKGIAPVNLPL